MCAIGLEGEDLQLPRDRPDNDLLRTSVLCFSNTAAAHSEDKDPRSLRQRPVTFSFTRSSPFLGAVRRAISITRAQY